MGETITVYVHTCFYISTRVDIVLAKLNAITRRNMREKLTTSKYQVLSFCRIQIEGTS